MKAKRKPRVHLIPTGDPLGRREWYQSRNGGGHPGYSELLAPGSTKRSALRRATERKIRKDEKKKSAEAYVPRERKLPEVVGWRVDDHGPIPGRVREHVQHSTKGVAALGIDVRSAAVERRRVSTPAPTPAPPSVLSVPVPADRVRPTDVTYASREGQQEFRKAIIAAYGQCAVTGCRVEEALEAAHIIPYVDGRSNLVTNGLCLRADIHRLYDRNLIQIGADGVVRVDPDIIGCYRDSAGAALIQPSDPGQRPDPALLAVRHKYIVSSRP